jgi:hypothetical protein
VLRFIVLLLATAAVAAPITLAARHRARQSKHARRRLLVASGLGLVAGATLAFWLPHQMPDTSGSPASLVAVVLFWIIGGAILFLSGAAFAGAVLGRPIDG